MRFSRLSGAALTVAALVAAMVASAAYGISTAGVTGQLDFKNCISDTGADTCTDVVAMAGPSAIALSDDESRVFAVSPSDNAVAVFSRDRATGKLEQLKMDSGNNKGGCTQEGNNPPCLPGHGLNGANDVVSVGGNAYIAATGSNAVVTLTKDASGRWKELDNNGSNQTFCLSTPAIAGCVAANGLGGATSITASGAYVYVGGPGRIAVFHRTKGAGALKQLADEGGCIGTGTGCTGGLGFGTIVDMMVSRDNKTLYAVDGSDVLVFSRNRTTGVLTQLASPTLTNVSGPIGVTADQQGTPTSVYVAGSNNVVGVFGRNKSDGTLTQLAGTNGCVSAGGGACTPGPRLANIGALTRLFAYKTNRFVYVAGDNGVAAFGRTKSGPNAGALTPLPDPAGCATETGDGGQCLAGKGIGGLTDIFSTGGGKHIYVAGADFNSVVTFHQGG